MKISIIDGDDRKIERNKKVSFFNIYIVRGYVGCRVLAVYALVLLEHIGFELHAVAAFLLTVGK